MVVSSVSGTNPVCSFVLVFVRLFCTFCTGETNFVRAVVFRDIEGMNSGNVAETGKTMIVRGLRVALEWMIPRSFFHSPTDPGKHNSC